VADLNAEPLLHPAVNAVNMASTSPTVGVAGQISGHTMNGAWVRWLFYAGRHRPPG
jgi:hypothetical protein